jgi:hypothetical protein
MIARGINSSGRHLLTVASSVVILTLTGTPVGAQWVKVPPPAVPRTVDGKPSLSALAPRLPNGKPDLSGLWQGNGKYLRNLGADLEPEGVPFQPWAKALHDERKDGAHYLEDPPASCLPLGVPRLYHAPPPWRIVQTPGYLVIVYEVFNLWRQVFLDGREFASSEELTPTWLGYSTGKWDGDTLVVDSRGFNGKAWLDLQGKPTTDALHIVERFSRKDVGHMNMQITIDDPKAYTRPWTVSEEARLRLDTELLEFICGENNFFLDLPGKK